MDRLGGSVRTEARTDPASGVRTETARVEPPRAEPLQPVLPSKKIVVIDAATGARTPARADRTAMRRM